MNPCLLPIQLKLQDVHLRVFAARYISIAAAARTPIFWRDGRSGWCRDTLLRPPISDRLCLLEAYDANCPCKYLFYEKRTFSCELPPRKVLRTWASFIISVPLCLTEQEHVEGRQKSGPCSCSLLLPGLDSKICRFGYVLKGLWRGFVNCLRGCYIQARSGRSG